MLPGESPAKALGEVEHFAQSLLGGARGDGFSVFHHDHRVKVPVRCMGDGIDRDIGPGRNFLQPGDYFRQTVAGDTNVSDGDRAQPFQCGNRLPAKGYQIVRVGPSARPWCT